MKIEEDDEVTIQLTPELLDLVKSASITGKELQELDSELTAYNAMTVFHLHGFLTSYVTPRSKSSDNSCFQYILPPSTIFSSEHEKEKIHNRILMMKKIISSNLLFGETFPLLVDYCDIVSPVIKPFENTIKNVGSDILNAVNFSLEQKYNLIKWCYGYVYGMEVNDSLWANFCESEDVNLLYPFTFFTEENDEDAALIVNKNEFTDMANALPEIVLLISDSFSERVNEKDNRKNRIKRNDPCHCGSGKKFKKCCI